MKKIIKIYTHHNQYEQVVTKRPFRFLEIIGNMVIAILQIIFELFYMIGLFLIQLIKSPRLVWSRIRQLPGTLALLSNQMRLIEFKKTLGIFAALLLISTFIVGGGVIISSGQSLKGRVLGTSDEGLKHLKDAQTALESQDVARAQNSFNLALQRFERSEEELKSSSLALKGILSTIPQKHDADRLLDAAQLLTDSAIDATHAYDLIQQIKITPEGVSGVDSSQETLQNLQGIIQRSTQKILKATELMDSVAVSSIPVSQRPAFLQVRDTLTSFKGSMTALRDTSDLLISIALGKKNVLFIFQNNNELRPTGGFIGTIGSAKIIDGQIKSLDIRSVYDLDGQMHEWIQPPKPLIAVNDRWYLRDGNWFADFKHSSAKLMALYEKEGGETPDMVMAFTPDLIIDLLKVTGPITLPQHNVTLDSDNFVETTQTSTSVAYSKELNQPKQLLADFFPVLMQRLGDNEKGFLQLLSVMHASLYKKNILLYASDPALQSKIESFNWGGRLNSTDRDYLSVVSANLGGTKTDRFLEKNISVQSEINPKGQIINTLTYAVNNPLPKEDGLHNTSFVRVFVPEQSKLISASGFVDNNLPQLTNSKYRIDSQVNDWEKNLTFSESSKIYTGSESNKTFFAGWIKVLGSESKTVTITYELPFALNNLDRHSLLIQKQPGSLPISYEYKLSHPERKLLWSSKDNSGGQDTASYNGQIITDTFLGLVLSR